MRGGPAGDVDWRKRVHRIANSRELAQYGGRVLASEQWPVVSPLDPLGQRVDRCIDPDRFCAGEDQFASLGMHERPAACRNDLGPTIDQPRNHSALSVAKLFLAKTFEDFRDRHARRRLDLMIGINERDVQALGQPFAHSRFANAHHPDQHDRSGKLQMDRGRVGIHAGGYTQRAVLGQKELEPLGKGGCVRDMSARIFRFVMVVAIAFAILYWLQSRVTDQPMVQQEEQVNLNEIR